MDDKFTGLPSRSHAALPETASELRHAIAVRYGFHYFAIGGYILVVAFMVAGLAVPLAWRVGAVIAAAVLIFAIIGTQPELHRIQDMSDS